MVTLIFFIVVIILLYYCRFYLFCITISSKLHQHPISSRLTLSVKQLQPVMAELKEAAKLFKQHKRLLTNSYHKLCRYIAERSVEPIESHRTHMIGLFKEFDELFDSVIDILVELQRDELMTPLLDYFKDEEAEYMHYLQVLESAVANLGRSVPPVWEPFQGSVKPNPIASLPDQFPASESKITNVLQKEQSCCMDNEHTSSPEVVPDSPVSPSHPEICPEPHGCKYHHQQAINISPIVTELCIDNLPADEIVKPVHVHDIHSNGYESLFKLQPCSTSIQPLNTVPIMYLNYNANDPPNIDTVNDSGMLVCQNFPGG